MANKNKKAEKAVEIASLKTTKKSGICALFANKTIEQRISDSKKIREVNIEKYNKEIASIRKAIIDAMNLQDTNKKISNENLKVYEDNMRQEKKNLETCTENLKYLTSLLNEVNLEGAEIEKILFEADEPRIEDTDNEEGF